MELLLRIDQYTFAVSSGTACTERAIASSVYKPNQRHRRLHCCTFSGVQWGDSIRQRTGVFGRCDVTWCKVRTRKHEHSSGSHQVCVSFLHSTEVNDDVCSVLNRARRDHLGRRIQASAAGKQFDMFLYAASSGVRYISESGPSQNPYRAPDRRSEVIPKS